MAVPIKPFAVQRGGGRDLATPTGDTAVVMADTAQTGGAMSVIDLVVAPQVGPALHRHEREDELWVVLEGEFRFKAGDVSAEWALWQSRPHVESARRPADGIASA